MEIEKLKKAFADIKDGISILGGGPVNFYLDHLVECREEFFSRCTPFRVGDTVELTTTPNTDNGWRESAHFLVQGAKGEVCEIDFSDGKFSIGIKIFNQTWIDLKGNEQPLKEGYIYSLPETHLRLLREV